MGWNGLGTQAECLRKPGWLQMPAWASLAVDLGLPATWALAVSLGSQLGGGGRFHGWLPPLTGL